MTAAEEVRRELEEFDRDPASGGAELRLSLATLILKTLYEKKWSQKKLANAAGFKPSYVNRVIHGEQNCTFENAGRLLFALGIKARIAQPHEVIEPRLVGTDLISDLIKGARRGKEAQTEVRSYYTTITTSAAAYSDEIERRTNSLKPDAAYTLVGFHAHPRAR